MSKPMDLHIFEAFQKRNPHTTSLDALFMILQNELSERFANARDEYVAPHGRELIGLAMRIKPREGIGYGGSLSAKATKHFREVGEWPERGKFDEAGFDGTVWFRLDDEYTHRMGSTDEFFRPSMMHIGGGGYSTWEGPWNDLGREMEKLNVGLPWGKKGKLAAYCFDIHFYTSDIPGLDHAEVMLKMQDKTWDQVYYFEWQKEEQAFRDSMLLTELEYLQGQQTA